MTTPLNLFAATLAPGQFAQFDCPSLTTPYDGDSYIFEPSPAAKAAAALSRTIPPKWNAVHMFDWLSCLPWHEASNTYWLAGGRDRQQALPQNLVTYDAATNTWTQRSAWSGAPGGHCYMQTAPSDDKVYYAGSGLRVWNRLTNSLGDPIPAAPNTIIPGFSNGLAAGQAAAFVPWLGSQGSVVLVNTNGSSDPTRSLNRIYRRDIALNAWVPVFGQRGHWHNSHTIAVPSRHGQKMLVGSTTAIRQSALGELDATGNVTFLPIGPMNATTGGGEESRGLVFEHPDRPEWCIGCLATNRIWSLPPGGPAWIDRQELPLELRNGNSAVMQTSFGAAFVVYKKEGASKMYAWTPDF